MKVDVELAADKAALIDKENDESEAEPNDVNNIVGEEENQVKEKKEYEDYIENDEDMEDFDEPYIDVSVFMQQQVECGDEGRVDIDRDLEANVSFFKLSRKHDKHVCWDCDYSTKYYTNFKQHRSSKHGGIKYPCDQCKYRATTRQHLKAHKARKHRADRHPCGQCRRTAENEGRPMEREICQHNGRGVTYPCDDCDFGTGQKRLLNRHRIDVHNIQPYQCDQCDFYGHNYHALRYHKKSKHEPLQFKCDQCDFGATQVGDVKRHKARKHHL